MRQLLIGGLLLLSSVAGWAQDPEGPLLVEIMESKPRSVVVSPGGKPDVLRIYGRGFEIVKEAQIRRAGTRANGVKARVKVISQGVADLEVTATSEAQPGTDYQLIFVTPSTSYPSQLEIEVVDPKE